jgi:hypothetical protein
LETAANSFSLILSPASNGILSLAKYPEGRRVCEGLKDEMWMEAEGAEMKINRE